MSDRRKLEELRIYTTRDILRIHSNCTRCKARSFLREFSNMTRSANPQLHSHSCDNLYLFHDTTFWKKQFLKILIARQWQPNFILHIVPSLFICSFRTSLFRFLIISFVYQSAHRVPGVILRFFLENSIPG